MDATGRAGLTLGELRRARRAFVLAHHPDRGGDPAAFAAGLARFALLLDQVGQVACPWTATDPPTTEPPRVVVVRRPRGVTAWLRHLGRAAAAGRRPRADRHLR